MSEKVIEEGVRRPSLLEQERAARTVIAFEDDPHRAALEDNPERVHVKARTWAAILFLALSFGPAIGLGFVSFASVVVSVSQALNGFSEYAWCVGAWSLASAVSFSLAGPLSDVFGRRNPILVGQAFVVVGCIVAGTAHSISALIAGEALIGFGTGFLFVSYAGVPEMLPNKWRGIGLGLLEAGINIPWGMVSALIGNSLYKNVSWRWIFFLGVIVEALSFIGTAFTYFPTSRPRGDFTKSRWQEFQEIDFMGLFLFTSGLTTFLIGVTWGGSTAHPWKSVGTILPIVLGFVVFASVFVYEAWAKNPMFPLSLLAQFRQFSLLLLILFISGMNFYSMTPLLPQGTLYMFTPDPTLIGTYALPNNMLQVIVGSLAPGLAHKIGHIIHVKYQLIFALVLQCVFTAATAGTVFPNHLTAWIVLPAFGIPCFIWITILAYSIASLHVPHSRLGVAMGLLGTFRAAGGAVGNAVFDTIFNDRFNSYVGAEVAPVAIKAGISPKLLPELIPAVIEYNIGVPTNGLLKLPGVTPAIAATLQTAARAAYGHAFKIVFYSTIPFTLIALVCGFFVEDSTPYLTNHIQQALGQDELKRLQIADEEKTSDAVVEKRVESVDK